MTGEAWGDASGEEALEEDDDGENCAKAGDANSDEPKLASVWFKAAM